MLMEMTRMRGSVDMNFMFTLGEVQRMLRAYADKQAARYGITRAQWGGLGKLAGLRSDMTATALEGIHPADAHRLLTQLETIKENVRNAIQNPAGEPPRKEQRFG